jgi:SAM-dependent methyltransferase
MPIHARLFADYQLSQLKCLDIGCGYGNLLASCGPHSVGLDIQQPAVDACRAQGLTAHVINVEEGLPDFVCKGDFDCCILSHVLEHVPSPHRLLIDIHQVLKPGGIIVLAVPTINVLGSTFGAPYRALKNWRPFRRLQLDGYLYEQHINFFTPTSLELTLMRAGYDRMYTGLPNLWPLLNTVGRCFLPVVWYVGRRRDAFQYADTTYMALRPDGRIHYTSDRNASV